jgi:hypothetical protein
MTAQTPDSLIFEGREVSLFSTPLEALWGESHPRPRFIPTSTGLWRGYVATWKVESGSLYLSNLEGRVCVDRLGNVVYGRLDFMQEQIGVDSLSASTRPISLALLFPDANGPVPATWFSGELRIPGGDCVEYVHMGYESVYERELRLRFERGVLVERRQVETGQEYRREVEALKARRDQERPAHPDAEGWITCPHCGNRFTTRDKVRWDGERHQSCGGRISLI